jgi:hypothetical protein
MPIKIDRNVLFPINQPEQAKQAKAEYLLAQDVFENIAKLIERGLEKRKRLESQPGGLDDLDQHRAHEAILLQGVRGSGKSAVLVNLDLYLQARHPAVAHDLLILKPIDPTLLENGESMFLDVFIAALVRDAQVKAKLDQGGREAGAFYDQLGKVGSALESAQTQKEQHGIERVRALIGGNSIADQVHKLFQFALRLTDKKLIILPIDDVDTALQHAYEKIEIVRKYLVSPFVVPLISGDIELYNDVIWRDIHGRLLAETKSEQIEAKNRAKELSIAYQRKILPLPRRIEVPKLGDYLNDPKVILADGHVELISFPVFTYWLEAVLNERVNGVENSYLRLPITTVREFAQLVSHVQELIPKLHTKLTELKLSTRIEIRRSRVMAPAIAACVANFSKEYNAVQTHEKRADRSSARAKAKTNFKSEVEKLPEAVGESLRGIGNYWQIALKSYFKYHQDGGAIYLTLEANDHFLACKAESLAYTSVFDTDLFKPRQHKEYRQFAQSAEIRKEWREHLESRMPGVWTKNFPETSVLPYPRPEIGRQITDSDRVFVEESFIAKAYAENTENTENAALVWRLMTHYNFYSKTNRARLTLTGRIFELLITTLIRNISEREVLDLMYRAPFYSVTEMVSTKTFDIAGEEESQNGEDADQADNFVWVALIQLVKDINAWRKENAVDLAAPPHAWLIYNVTNKYFNQANYFNILPTKGGSKQKSDSLLEVVGTALQAFNAIWAIFGSFEKGPVFGFDEVIAYMNVGEGDKDFTQNQLYKQNILPFLRVQDDKKKEESPFFNFQTGAYTYLLSSHPLKKLLQETYDALPKYIAKNTNLPENAKNLQSEASIKKINERINERVNEVLRGKKLDVKGATLNNLVKEIEDELGAEAELVFELAKDEQFSRGRSGLSKLRRLLDKIKQEEQSISTEQIPASNSPDV